jgi:hypothetical protein
MPLIECLDCKREISDRARQCIHCGAPVSQRAPDTHTGAVETLITSGPREFLGLVDQVNQDVSAGPLAHRYQLRDIDGYQYFTAPDVHVDFNDIDGQDQSIKVGDLVFFERKLNENGRLQKIRKLSLPQKEKAIRTREFSKANGRFVVNEERIQKWLLAGDSSRKEGSAAGQQACPFCAKLGPIGEKRCHYCGEIFVDKGQPQSQAPASFSEGEIKKERQSIESIKTSVETIKIIEELFQRNVFYRLLRFIGFLFLVFGILVSLTGLGAFIGVPMIISGAFFMFFPGLSWVIIIGLLFYYQGALKSFMNGLESKPLSAKAGQGREKPKMPGRKLVQTGKDNYDYSFVISNSKDIDFDDPKLMPRAIAISEVINRKSEAIALAALLGAESEEFLRFLVVSSSPTKNTEFNATIKTGMAPHSGGSQAALVMFDANNNYWIALRDTTESSGEQIVRYYTTHESSIRKLPKSIQDWMAEFLKTQELRGGEKPKLTVIGALISKEMITDPRLLELARNAGFGDETSNGRRLPLIFVPEMLNARLEKLEMIAGPSIDVNGDIRSYKVDGCAVTAHLTGTGQKRVIQSLKLAVEDRCSFDLNAFVSGAEIKPLSQLTFGRFDLMTGGTGRFYADCLTHCGNAYDPSIYLHWTSRKPGPNFEIMLGAFIVDDGVINASNTWEDSMTRNEGDEWVMENRFNSTTKYDSLAHQLFQGLTINNISIGYNLNRHFISRE